MAWYDDLKFDGGTFDRKLEELIKGVRSQNDDTIAQVTNKAAQAGAIGATGVDQGQITADILSKILGDKNREITNVTANIGQQKLQAEQNFNQQKQQYKAQDEASTPGFLDWLTTGVQIAGGVAAVIASGGAAAPLIAGIGTGLGGVQKGLNQVTRKQPEFGSALPAPTNGPTGPTSTQQVINNTQSFNPVQSGSTGNAGFDFFTRNLGGMQDNQALLRRLNGITQ